MESICHQSKTNLEDIVPSIIVHDIDRILEAEDLYESTSRAKGVVSQRVCLVCLVSEPDTLIILSRHAQTCYSCTETIAKSLQFGLIQLSHDLSYQLKPIKVFMRSCTKWPMMMANVEYTTSG